MCAAKRLSEAERKKEIMDSAAKIIIAKGFEKTTMEEIIAGTTLSKGGVYHYYGSVAEIFRDIMLDGIEYRNEMIKANLNESAQGIDKRFMAAQLLEKIVDDNPYMPLYVEFLLAKKRNPELESLFTDLQEYSRQRMNSITNIYKNWLFDDNIFQFMTDFINAMIMACNILHAREVFKANRELLLDMICCIFKDSVEQQKNAENN